MKDILQKNKEDVINAITEEKNKEISELKNDIKAIDKISSTNYIIRFLKRFK